MSYALKGKNAIVTGGSRGIGRAVARDLAKLGANVLINYVSPSSEARADAFIQEVAAMPSGAKAAKARADMSKADAGGLLQDMLKQAFGHELDILVQNAGVVGNQMLSDITEEEYYRVMDINVKGVILSTRALLPCLAKGGRIILLSSVSARMGYPGQTIYGASKAAIEGIARVWAHELAGQDIKVNCINPGPVKTDMWEKTTDEFKQNILKSGTPVGEPQDIADLVTFLASDQSRWCNASVLNANNGMCPV